MTNVEVIPAIVKRKTTIRVAAYARVSVSKDMAIQSLSQQVDYYSKLINATPDWAVAGIYIDEALTGTKDTRDNFQRLMEDCRAGKVDQIITKTVSRFARNTVTLLSSCRELKSLGIDVYFEAQHIHSISDEGELLLTLMASLAQEEARSDSENMKWRVRKNFEQGKPWNVHIFGYRFRNGAFEIEPTEAEVVKEIYADYLSGLGYQAIAKKLNENNKAHPMYVDFWAESTVRHILSHYAYTGNLLLQRFYNESYITKKTVKNRGELPMYHAENTHEPIISKERWQAVQDEKQSRDSKYKGSHKSDTMYPFTGILQCPYCGKNYRRKTTATGIVWICPTFNSKGKAHCPKSKAIPDTTLTAVTVEALGLRDFDEEQFRETVSSITAFEGNRIRFHLKGGGSVDRTWKDRSRAESWTEQMKEEARQATKRRRSQNAENNKNRADH